MEEVIENGKAMRTQVMNFEKKIGTIPKYKDDEAEIKDVHKFEAYKEVTDGWLDKQQQALDVAN